MQCEILKILHIVDVHVDHIQRDLVFTITVRYFAEILLRLVTPTALSEAEGVFRRNVASADDLPELLYNIIGRIPFNDKQV